jgi:hypothetical protein
MLALKNKCKKCNDICNSIHWLYNFENWTSGNGNIDKFIQNTQLSAHYNVKEALEWITYDRFCDIKSTAKTNVFKANWIDGHIDRWDDENQNWQRLDQNMIVTLKSLNDPKNVTLEFISEVK